MTFSRAVLVGLALPFLGIGLVFLAAPNALAPQLGLALSGALADHDVRAVYGGLQIGVGLFLLRAGLTARAIAPALEAAALVYAGLAAARGVGWVVAGDPGPLGLALHAGETLGLALAVVALRARTA